MATSYVVDRSAVLSVQTATSNPTAVFDCWTGWVQRGDMTFPTELVNILKQRESGEVASMWLSAVSSSRSHKGATYGTHTQVARTVPALIDVDAETGELEALAQAFEINGAADGEAVVITEDTIDKGTRIALTSACNQMGIAYMSVPEFLTICGCGGFLS